jgi:hypothetical protein
MHRPHVRGHEKWSTRARHDLKKHRDGALERPQDGVSSFIVRIDFGGGRLEVSGRLDHRTAHVFSDAIRTLLSSDGDAWTVDVVGLTDCDPTGLRDRRRLPAGAAPRAAADAGRRPLLAPAGAGPAPPGPPPTRIRSRQAHRGQIGSGLTGPRPAARGNRLSSKVPSHVIMTLTRMRLMRPSWTWLQLTTGMGPASPVHSSNQVMTSGPCTQRLITSTRSVMANMPASPCSVSSPPWVVPRAPAKSTCGSSSGRTRSMSLSLQASK